MRRKAQIGLEYLLTYGWAIIIVLAVIGGLVLAINSNRSDLLLYSSDPTKISVSGGKLEGNQVELVLRNQTGAQIQFAKVQLDGAIFTSDGTVTLNQVDITEIDSDNKLTIESDGLMLFKGIKYVGSGAGKIELYFSDFASLQRYVEITGRRPSGNWVGGQECGVDEDCTGDLQCCAGVCRYPACILDEDCDDFNPLTVDVCLDPSSCAASCTSVICSVECSSDADCDDSDSCTSDNCSNPGICSSNCSNNQIISCMPGDGCCPAGCNANNDSDCSTSCGNDVCESGECDAGCSEDCEVSDCCPNTTCDTGIGEDCSNCEADCGACAAVCGNDVKETGEVCDGTDLDGQDCTTQGFTTGTLACQGDCAAFDTSNCSSQVCGNNILEGDEKCESTEFNDCSVDTISSEHCASIYSSCPEDYGEPCSLNTLWACNSNCELVCGCPSGPPSAP